MGRRSRSGGRAVERLEERRLLAMVLVPVWSSYVGGSNGRNAAATVVDAAGNVYVAGYEELANPSWPDWLDRQGYVAKISPRGELLWRTALTARSEVSSLALDVQGNVYAAGRMQFRDTVSGSWDGRTHDRRVTHWDGVVAKITSDGAVLRTTRFGGILGETVSGVAVDAQGNAYVCGQTDTRGFFWHAYEGISGGDSTDARGYIVRVDAAGELGWVRYVDGRGGAPWGTYSYINAIMYGQDGNLYVTGNGTYAAATVGFGAANGTGVRVAKVSTNGTILWSGCFGPSTWDSTGRAIVADQAGNLYVAGSTGTSGWTSGGFDTSYGGAYDGFLARVNADGTLGWTSYIGGAGNDRVNGLAVDASGSLYVAGVTGSSGWASGGYDTVLGGSKDGFVAKATPEGALVWSSYVGGDGNESVDAAAVSQSGSLYVTGSTSSAGWVSGGFDTSYNEGTSEGFVAKLGRPPVPVVVEGTDVSDTIDVAVRGDQYVVTITGSHVYYELTEVASLSIYGRNGNDNITVTPDVVVAVSIYGGAGNDSVFGGSGDDLIEGGEGNDTLIAAAGNDTLYGHDGADRLYGQAGDDELYGNAGNDSAYGGDGCDVVFGQAGDDVLYGNFGNDTMQGGDGQDSVMGGLGVDSLLGGLGNDSIYGGDGSDTIDGNEGDDHLEGKGKADTLYGGSGNDTIIGGAGADLIMAEDGDDWIGAADQYFVDSVYGGAGWDVMEHDAGDLLEGVEVSVLG